MRFRICSVGLMAAISVLAGSMDVYDLVRSGESLSLDEAHALEAGLKDESGSVGSRLKLLGFYNQRRFADRNSAQARQTQVLWLVKNAPDHEVHGTPYCQLNAMLDGSAYEEGRDLWTSYAEETTNSTVRLSHAANYLLLSRSDLSERFLKKAQKIEPENPKWGTRLAQVYSLRRKNDASAEDVKLAKMELEQLESAYTKSDEMSRDAMRADMAKAAYSAGEYGRAKEVAKKMVSKSGSGWNSGNNIHQGNMVLGLVALQENEVDAAKKYLIASGKTKGSPQLDSFGPNMTLAKALLEKGEKEAVLEYFECCRTFWEMDGGRLDQWAALVKDGLIPDFGANLRY